MRGLSVLRDIGEYVVLFQKAEHAHERTLYAASIDDEDTIGITDIILSFSSSFLFNLVKQARVPSGHCKQVRLALTPRPETDGVLGLAGSHHPSTTTHCTDQT